MSIQKDSPEKSENHSKVKPSKLLFVGLKRSTLHAHHILVDLAFLAKKWFRGFPAPLFQWSCDSDTVGKHPTIESTKCCPIQVDPGWGDTIFCFS